MPLSTRAKLIGLRLQSSFLRARRWLSWIARGVTLVAVAAGAVATGRLVERYVRSAQTFATKHLEVDGNRRLSTEGVLQAAGLALGRNVFEVSPEQAEARLLREPWIVEADVSRRLPGSYRVVIRERTAAAVLVLDQIFLVGDDGSLFKLLEAGDPRDLPVVTGVDRARFASDPGFRSELLLNVVALMHDYRDAGLWRREPIAEIHAEDDGGFALYVGDDPAHVRLGRPPFRSKLHRLRGVFDQLDGEKNRPAYVYLDNQRRPDRVTVRLQ
jgi:cell division protein FtsQ